MEERRYTPGTWLDLATAGIRFGPDRAAVRRELAAHLEDKRADLRRRYPDLSEQEADELAAAQMGDPGELGKELARVHKPWLGYLWRVSQGLVGVLLAVTVLLWWPGVWAGAVDLVFGLATGGDAIAWYLRGDDPTQAGGPEEPEPGEKIDADRELVLIIRPGASVRIGDYTLAVDRAALWRSRDRATGRGTDTLYLALTAWGPPWQKLTPEVVLHLTGRDDRGGRYDSTIYPDREGPRLRVGSREMGVFRSTWPLEVHHISPGAQWLRLEYDWNGTQWELTIPLTEEESER